VIDLELPVMADLTYDKLRVAPCRHAGAVFSDDLVIAAHNYDKHFGKLNQLQLGDEVVFTDMDSDLYRYEVVRMETVNPTDVERVLESGNDLVMYTCTYGGKTRVVVYCDYIDS
jgi:sortase A